MKKTQIKRIYREYFELANLGIEDFKDFLKDVWHASTQGSVSSACSNFPSKYRWESLIRYGEVRAFIEEALKSNNFDKFSEKILSILL